MKAPEPSLWRMYLSILIACIWAISYIGSVVTENYTGFEVATPVMVIAAGWLLGKEVQRRNGMRNGDNHGAS